MRLVIVGVLVENAALTLVINFALAWFLLWSALLRRQLWLSLQPQRQPRPNRQDILSDRVPHHLGHLRCHVFDVSPECDGG